MGTPREKKKKKKKKRPTLILLEHKGNKTHMDNAFQEKLLAKLFYIIFPLV